MTTTPCTICNNSQADEITLHYTSDGWDTPFRVRLCREHQRELIGPVQEAVRKMLLGNVRGAVAKYLEEREAQCQ